jgi:signal transduction histidine kinase
LGTLVASVSVLNRYLDGTEPHVRGELERIQRNVWRCVRIIEDLLEFSRNREATLRPIAIDNWIQQQIDEMRPTNGVKVSLDLASGAEVLIDGEKLRQAFGNILHNAFQAVECRDESKVGEQAVIVSTRNLERMVTLAVTDNGPGMNTEVKRRMFEPLFSTKAFGVGLGMPLVKRIAEQHGGRVDVDSEEGSGTTVTVLLPISQRGRGDAPAGNDGNHLTLTPNRFE